MGAGVEVPDGIGGSTVILERSDAIVATAGAHGSDELLLGVSGPVGATAEGATLEEIRSFLLEVPGVPESLVMQLSAVEEWRTVLELDPGNEWARAFLVSTDPTGSAGPGSGKPSGRN